MNDDLKPLMIHVERIVRPVCATANRKLRMRRELLAHLQAAMDEERPNGGTESEVLTRAKSRLGDSALLTQQLQLTVPKFEQLFLRKLPAPKFLDRWKQRSEKQWGLLTTTQALAMMGFSMLFTATATGGWVFNIPEESRSAFFNMQSDNHARYLLICLVACAIATTLPLLIITLLEKALHKPWYSRAVLIYAAIVALCVFLWILLINSQVALRPLNTNDLLWGIMTGIALVTVEITIAKIIARAGNHSLEWKQLNIAD